MQFDGFRKPLIALQATMRPQFCFKGREPNKTISFCDMVSFCDNRLERASPWERRWWAWICRTLSPSSLGKEVWEPSAECPSQTTQPARWLPRSVQKEVHEHCSTVQSYRNCFCIEEFGIEEFERFTRLLQTIRRPKDPRSKSAHRWNKHTKDKKNSI